MKKMKALAALALSGALLLSAVSPAFAVSTSDAPTGVSKEETVYLLLNPDGSVERQIVSCWLHADTGVRGVNDQSSLTNIANIKSNVAPTVSGSSLRWDMDGNDVYYNGSTDKTPPLSLSVDYTLDGKPLTAQELLGKSGRLRIHLKLTNNEWKLREIDGTQRKIYTPFAAMMVLDLPNKTFRNIDADGSSVLTESTNQIVTFAALPGMKESLSDLLDGGFTKLTDKLRDEYTVTADVENFEMPQILLAAATDFETLKKIDLNDTVTKLSDGMEELKDASGKLTDGTQKLSEALSQFDASMGAFGDSYGQFGDGLTQAIAGVQQLKDGSAQLKEASSILKAKVTDQLVPGLQGSAALQKELTDKMDSLQKQLENLSLPDLSVIQSQLSAAVGSVCDASSDATIQILTGGQGSFDTLSPQQQAALTAAKDQIKQQAGAQIAQMMATLDLSALQSLEQSLQEISGLASRLMGSMDALTQALYNPNDDLSNPQTLAGAIIALAAGADRLDSGASSLTAGTASLSDASGKVKDAIAQMKDATSQLSDKSGELSGGMGEFSEKAIDPLCDSGIVEKLDTALAVKDAMQEQAEAFGTYCGAPDGSEVTTKFVMKMNPVTAEKAEAEEAPPQEQLSFWDKVVSFFQNLFH